MDAIIIVLFILFVFFTLTTIIMFGIKLYFLNFDFNNHPDLIKMMENVGTSICAKEGISIFIKTYEELNAEVDNDMDKALGRYYYVQNNKQLKLIKKTVLRIKKLEKEYHKSYEEICKSVNINTNIREELCYPRIILCSDQIKMYGVRFYYSTFYHEIGHHFAIKTDNHSENYADIIGWNIIQSELPDYFQLIFEVIYNIKIMWGVKVKSLTGRKRLKAYINFCWYLIKNKHINKKYNNERH